ncbi:MAG TPA: NAD(P)/FAD-dependent oxidoreductase [Nevskiaceae bacterium]|nr:NAD(P)/FAD-dependent oxidoreductase [Nevskiaceae bacterium]
MLHDIIILGGGAAGLMCAIQAGRRGRRVTVLEHANRVGKKILMSGGGRCNFTNLHVTPANFLSGNPHFCKSALARFTQWDFIAMVDRHGIAWHEKELGQLFCDDSSKQIVRMLVDECADAGVRIETDCAIEAVRRGDDGRFVVATSRGEQSAAALVVATGGLSIPKMGATGLGYEIARQFGHRIAPTRAALVPLTLSGRPLDDVADLSGLALPVEAKCGDAAFRAGFLFTHRGISGPAILQISSYWEPGAGLTVDWLPEVDALETLTAARNGRPGADAKSVLSDLLPKRLAQRLCELKLGDLPLRQWSNAKLQEMAALLHDWPFVVSGTEGYRTAEVTLGGVDTAELSSTTMESRKVPGLYFIGEVVDVTGHLGGFNFQWAWASGHAAGQAA